MSRFIVSNKDGKVCLEIANVGTIRLAPGAADDLAASLQKHAKEAAKPASGMSWEKVVEMAGKIKKDLGL